MKDTVTKSAKKSGSPAVAGAAGKTGSVKAVASALTKKSAGAPAARPAARKGSAAVPAAKAKPAVTPVAKAPPAPAVKKAVAVKAAPAKAADSKAAAPKAAAKSLAAAAARPAVKAQTAQAAQTPALKTPAPKAPKASTKKTVEQQAVKAGETGARTEPVASVTAELADKMKTSVVSKVSEVMTKTTKSTPAQDGRLISEDEIRTMGEKDYMNPAQLAFFKARLQQLEKDLLKNAGETTEHLRETVLVPDPADRATIEEEHALELRTRDRERKLLKKVQQSIAAIDGGDYGWCEETGEPIGIPRLIARPTATLSLEAQQRRELKQKLYGD